MSTTTMPFFSTQTQLHQAAYLSLLALFPNLAHQPNKDIIIQNTLTSTLIPPISDDDIAIMYTLAIAAAVKAVQVPHITTDIHMLGNGGFTIC